MNLHRVRGTAERQGTLWFIAGEGGIVANTFLSGTAGSTTQGAHSSALTTDWDGHLPCLPGAPLNPGRDAQLDSVQPPTPPSRDSSLKLPLDTAGLPKPGTTPLAASPQCAANKELVTPAEAPIILSSPRTSKTDSYDLVWRPRPDSRAPILYYVVKHRKVSLFCPAAIFPLHHSMGGMVASPRVSSFVCRGTHRSLVALVSGTS